MRRPHPYDALERALRPVVRRLPARLRAIPGPAAALIGLLVVINLCVWAAVGVILRFYPRLTGTAVLAYTLGLRHALDADHISAIDLMTRRLIAAGQRPVAVGTFFSLGHSTIVIITCVVVAATSGALRERFHGFERVGNIIGTSVSAAVLLILCAGNAWVLWRLVRGLRAELRRQHDQEWADEADTAADEADEIDNGDDDDGRAPRRLRSRESAHPPPPYRDDGDDDAAVRADADAVAAQDVAAEDAAAEARSIRSVRSVDHEAHARARSGPNAVAAATAPTEDGAGVGVGSGTAANSAAAHLRLEGGGFLVRVFRRLFVLIDRPWKMYPLGILFGLGFDTSSEVALLGIASIQGAQGTSMWLILIFPALFTAGMCMIDTTDGALMMALYTSKHFARDTVAILYYSIVLTGITIVVAAFIGVVQVLSLVDNVASPTGSFWDGVGAIGDHFDIIGGSICGLFLLAGITSVLVYEPWRRRMRRRLAARAAAAADRGDHVGGAVQVVDLEEAGAGVGVSGTLVAEAPEAEAPRRDAKTQRVREREVGPSTSSGQ